MRSKTRPTWAMRGYEQTTYHVNSKDEIEDSCQGMNEEGLCVMTDSVYGSVKRDPSKDKPGVESGLSSVENLYEDSEYL